MSESKIPEGYKSGSWKSPIEELVGPFYYKKNENGQVDMAFLAEEKHNNGLGIMHGGMLMTFGDYAITMQALSGYKENCLTISFNCEFIAPAKIGDLIEAKIEVVKRTGSLVFLKGSIFSGKETLLTLSAVVKRIRRQDQ